MRKAIGLSVLVFAAAFAGGVAPGPSAAEKEVLALEARWDEANRAGDADGLAALLDDGFIETGTDGAVRTKAQMVGALRAKEIKFESSKTEELKVMLYGDAAVVNGIWAGTYTYGQKRVNSRERFSNFWVRRGGKWKCVASHGSAIQSR